MSLPADYYDGRSARRILARLSAVPGEVWLDGEGLERRAPLGQVRISERLGGAPRLLWFADGAHAEVRDHAGFEAWLAAVGYRERRIDLLQRSWIAAGASLALLVIAASIGYRWGLPLLAEEVAENMPRAVIVRISDHVLDLLDSQVLEASQLPVERQAGIERQFAALVAGEHEDVVPVLLFRRSRGLGANAIALPDGRMVLLDDLVLLADDDEQILAVLAHELGHVHLRHKLRMLVQGTATGAAFAWWIGDFSSVIAAAPAALMQARYSQKLESEADAYAAQLLRARALSPELLAQILEKLQTKADLPRAPGVRDDAASSAPVGRSDAEEPSWSDYLSSHPATRERIRALREAP